MAIEDAEDSSKDDFYGALQEVINDTPRHDLTILAGDFNVQISSEPNGSESTISPFGIATQTNDNSVQLISFCAANQFAIKNTYHQHKRIYKATDGSHMNENNCICVCTYWRSTINDVKTRRSADIDSDDTFSSQTVGSSSNAYSRGLNRTAHSILPICVTPQRW